MKFLPLCRVTAAVLALLLSPRVSDASEIADKYSRFLMIVDGDSSDGSASVVRYRGNTLILTNAHVVSGNNVSRFRLLNSREVTPEVFGVAEDRDLLVARQKGLTEGIEVCESVEKEVSIGDEVVVLGNSQGRSVVTEIAGKVTGIGPELIEVDAKFVPGNSGSPIIHVKSGKVIGVATFVTVRKADVISEHSDFTEVRRFAYRLDTVAKWQFCAPAKFVAEGTYLAMVQDRTTHLLTMAHDLKDDGLLDADKYPGNQGWISNYIAAFGKGWPEDRMQQLKFTQTAKEFTTHLNSDISGMDASSFSPFHREALQREVAMRQLLARFFGNVQWNTVRFEGWTAEPFGRRVRTVR